MPVVSALYTLPDHFTWLRVLQAILLRFVFKKKGAHWDVWEAGEIACDAS